MVIQNYITLSVPLKLTSLCDYKRTVPLRFTNDRISGMTIQKLKYFRDFLPFRLL